MHANLTTTNIMMQKPIKNAKKDNDGSAICGDIVKKHRLFHTNKLSFPYKLHVLLDEVSQQQQKQQGQLPSDRDNTEQEKLNIISWLPHGRSFHIHSREKFEKLLMPRFFKQTQYKSFQRQLHIYDFHKVQSGYDKGAYYHKSFIRDEPSLSLHMKRCVKVQHKDKSKSTNTDTRTIENGITQSHYYKDRKYYAYIRHVVSERAKKKDFFATRTPQDASYYRSILNMSPSQQETLPIEPKIHITTSHEGINSNDDDLQSHMHGLQQNSLLPSVKSDSAPSLSRPRMHDRQQNSRLCTGNSNQPSCLTTQAPEEFASIDKNSKTSNKSKRKTLTILSSLSTTRGETYSRTTDDVCSHNNFDLHLKQPLHKKKNNNSNCNSYTCGKVARIQEQLLLLEQNISLFKEELGSFKQQQQQQLLQKTTKNNTSS